MQSLKWLNSGSLEISCRVTCKGPAAVRTMQGIPQGVAKEIPHLTFRLQCYYGCQVDVGMCVECY